MNLVAVFERLREGGRLDLSELGITDGDLVHIAGMSSEADEGAIAEVNLSTNPITNAGLANLSPLVDLEVLVLCETQVGAEGIGHLRQLGKLRELSLDGPNFTDEVLDAVAQLTTLKVLYAYDGAWTQAALERLRGLRPDIEIRP